MKPTSGLRQLPRLEVAIFAAGLIASVAVGVAAYDRYGMYGDGPGGPGFSRTEDPVSGAWLLVHEMKTSEGRLRRTFGPGGALIEVEVDKDDDGNVDEKVKIIDGRCWEFYTNGVLKGVAIDTDGDGKPDQAR